MEKIEGSKLNSLRLERAKGLINLLRDEIDDLKRRLSLVEVHNEELQQLFEKLSADQAALDLAVEQSLENIDESFDDTIDAAMYDEIADAEEFVIDASDDEDEEFIDDDEE